jgi:hypothetical protein
MTDATAEGTGLVDELRSLATSLKRPGGKDSRITRACTRAADRIEALEAALAKAVADEREACAVLAEPNGPRPCDCRGCYCCNVADAARVVEWDEATALAAAIRARALQGEPT